MAKVHGKNATFKIDDSTNSDTLTAVTSLTNSITLDVSVDVAEVTSFGETYKTFLEGVAEWSISGELFYSATNAESDDILFAVYRGFAVGTECDIEFKPDGSQAYTGKVILTKYTITSGVGGGATISFAAQGTGLLSRA